MEWNRVERGVGIEETSGVGWCMCRTGWGVRKVWQFAWSQGHRKERSGELRNRGGNFMQ